MPEVSLRPVWEEDCRLLWEWANDPEVRRQSWNQNPIPWEEHVRWFGEKIVDPDCYIYIATDDSGQPIGEVRFEVDGNSDAVVSVSIHASHRTRGYGSLALEQAARMLLKVRPLKTITAFIKPENLGSIRAFEKAGFDNRGWTVVNGRRAICMSLTAEGLATVDAQIGLGEGGQ